MAAAAHLQTPIRPSSRRLYRELPFFASLIGNLEMTLAKSSLEIAREYLALVPDELEPERFFALIAAEHERTLGPCSRSSARSGSWSATPRFDARSASETPTSTP